jgi:hypothetical protein
VITRLPKRCRTIQTNTMVIRSVYSWAWVVWDGVLVALAAVLLALVVLVVSVAITVLIAVVIAAAVIIVEADIVVEAVITAVVDIVAAVVADIAAEEDSFRFVNENPVFYREEPLQLSQGLFSIRINIRDKLPYIG